MLQIQRYAHFKNEGFCYKTKVFVGCGAASSMREKLFLGFGLTVTEQISTKTRLKKNLNNKRCRDGMPKSMQTK